jgi:hypothetical protein
MVEDLEWRVHPPRDRPDAANLRTPVRMLLVTLDIGEKKVVEQGQNNNGAPGK